MQTSENPGNPAANVGRYFDKASAIWDTFYDDQRSPFMRWVDRRFRSDVYERFARTFAAITPLEGKSVLDIGCGSGPYAVECARRGAARVVGLDVAPGMLDIARKRAADLKVDVACTFIQGQFPHDAPAEQFDHCIVMGVMDYVADKGDFLRRLRACARRSAAVSFPSWHWFRGPIRAVRYKIKRCPLWLYTQSQIDALMRAAGFSRVHIDKIPGAGMDYFVVGEA